VDVTSTPKRKYRDILPKLKRGELIGQYEMKPLPKRPLRKFDANGVKITATRSGKGFVLDVKSDDIREEDLSVIFFDIQQSILKSKDEEY